ncbi:MAG: DUF2087 domain-containing protein [Chloroflexota bacterium]
MIRSFYGEHTPVQSRVELTPVYNVLNSFALIEMVDRMPALGDWVRQTAIALAPPQHRANRIIFEHLGAALLIDNVPSDFAAYVDMLAKEAPQAMHKRICEQQSTSESVIPEVAALLADPLKLHDLVVMHMRMLWEDYGASEWKQVQRKLQQHVEMLQNSIPGSGIAPDAITNNLQRYIAGAVGLTPGITETVFVPSRHTGRHITQLQVGTTLYLFFDAQLHSGVVLRDTSMKQLELSGRLSALTEPARLRVLTLLAQHDELTLQDLMTLLDTSQPNVSRYLKSLGSFVREQRGKDGRKWYRLVPTELDTTFQALQQTILASPNMPATPGDKTMQPQGLKHYLDEQGVVRFWPGQEGDHRAMLTYLADYFAAGNTYGEKEVNAILTQYVPTHVRDHVTVRRDLVDYHFLERSDSGAQYWRSNKPTGEEPRILTDEEAYTYYWGGELPESTS